MGIKAALRCRMVRAKGHGGQRDRQKLNAPVGMFGACLALLGNPGWRLRVRTS